MIFSLNKSIQQVSNMCYQDIYLDMPIKTKRIVNGLSGLERRIKDSTRSLIVGKAIKYYFLWNSRH